MTSNLILQCVFYLAVLILLAKPLGLYMARIYEDQPALINTLGRPVERLVKIFKWNEQERSVLMGDLNEWFLWGRPLKHLHRYFDETPAVPTFPSGRPIFALDRLWTHPGSLLRGLKAHDSALARSASDHLPLVATLQI